MNKSNWSKDSSFHSQHLRDKKRVEELKKNKKLQEKINKVKKL